MRLWRPEGSLAVEQEPAGGATAAPHQRREREPAGWLDAVVALAAIGVVCIGLVGIPLAMAGKFRPGYVAGGSLALLAVVVLLARSALLPVLRRSSWQVHAASFAAVLVAAASVVDNARSASQHFLADGDPGIYAITGKFLAADGSLHVHVNPALFGNDQTINYVNPGFFVTDHGTVLYPQFFHLLPALLGVADWVGGTAALMRLNALLAGLGLLAIFAFASRFMPPLFALVAMVGVAVTLPQLYFSRDTFSEVPSQLLVFAGLCLLWRAMSAAERRPVRCGLLAGLALGGSMMARIDAFLYPVPIAIAMCVYCLAAPQHQLAERQRRIRITLAVALGLAIPGAVGAADGVLGTPGYFVSKAGEVLLTLAALVLCVLVGIALLTRPSWGDSVRRFASPMLRGLAPVAVVLVVAGAAFAWGLRPHVAMVHRPDLPGVTAEITALQHMEHQAIDPTRAYDEMSMVWLSWYLGPVLALAMVGLAWAAFRLLRGKVMRLLPFVLLVAVVAAGYIWKPSIVPVQYWAMRRYLPVVLPGFVVLACFLAAELWRVRVRSSVLAALGRVAAQGLACVLAGVVLVTPFWLLHGTTRLVRSYTPVDYAVGQLCNALQPNDVVLIVGGGMTLYMPQTIEAFCGNQAAVAGLTTERNNIDAVAASAKSSGHRLVLVGSEATPTDIHNKPLGVTLAPLVSIQFNTEALSLTHRPDSVFPVDLAIYLSPLS